MHITLLFSVQCSTVLCILLQHSRARVFGDGLAPDAAALLTFNRTPCATISAFQYSPLPSIPRRLKRFASRPILLVLVFHSKSNVFAIECAAESLKAQSMEVPLKWVALSNALDEINQKRADLRRQQQQQRCAHCGLPKRSLNADARSNVLVLVEDERASKELRQALLLYIYCTRT